MGESLRLWLAALVALIVGLALGYGIIAVRGPSVVTVTTPSPVTVTQTQALTQTVTQVMTTTVTVAEAYTIMLAYKPGIGFYLVDSKGRTLYFFSPDFDGKSRCYGECAVRWPPFYVDKIVVPPGLDPKDFTVITRDDGRAQIAYKGWPLYHFFMDQQPGDVKGDGRVAFGGPWFVAKPDYTVMIAVKEGLGQYLVDGRGRTLYYFARDTPLKSACYGECAARWPIFQPRNLVVPSTLKLQDFAFILRDDGLIQLTYKGRPLYYWVNDKARGDTTGHGVGGVWVVGNIEGKVEGSVGYS